MTESEAQAWVRDRFGAPALGRLGRYVALLVHGAAEQNLVARSTLPHVWARHIVDSAQLLILTDRTGSWVDIGSGAGLPGLVVAMLSDRPVLLVEPRRLRVAFLEQCVAALGLADRVRVAACKAEALRNVAASVISARAVAPLRQLLASTQHLAAPETVWLLPKGAGAESEVAEARRTWQGVFHVKPSLVDPASGIVVASRIARR